MANLQIEIRGTSSADKSALAQQVAKSLKDDGIDVTLFETEGGYLVNRDIKGAERHAIRTVIIKVKDTK